MNKYFKYFLFSITFIAFLLVLSTASVAEAQERYDGGYSTIVDENGNTVYITARNIEIGDEVLTENNKRYEVFAVDGDTAKAKLVGEVILSYYEPQESFQENLLEEVEEALEFPVANAQTTPKIAIYHTHSDESYVPTDHKESIDGAGGIYKVGEKFKSALESKGLKVALSEAKHDPHDDMAYERSRRTALGLIKKEQPTAIFDIHRDAVPPEVYKTTINGQDVSKLQLVVGKHGPTAKQIEDYALQIKAASDKTHPGLVKGIFFAKGGDYNQDLHPRSMLIEAGAHTNDRISAERGIAMFADVVPVVLGTGGQPAGTAGTTNAANKNTGGTTMMGAGTTGTPNPGTGGGIGSVINRGFSGTTKSIALIIGIVVLGSAAFLYLSTGSLKEAKGKLRQFVTTEFANFFGSPKEVKNINDTAKIEKNKKEPRPKKSKE